MVLTPQARAIAALVLATSVVLGSWSRGSYALNMLLLQNNEAIRTLIGAIVPLAVGGLAYVLASSAARTASDTSATTWDAHVAGAARMVAAAAIVLTLLLLLGGLVRGDGSGYNPFF
jgi:hypothetical protein